MKYQAPQHKTTNRYLNLSNIELTEKNIPGNNNSLSNLLSDNNN